MSKAMNRLCVLLYRPTVSNCDQRWVDLSRSRWYYTQILPLSGAYYTADYFYISFQWINNTVKQTQQVCVDHPTSDRNVRRWPLLLSGAGGYRSIDGTNRRTDGRTDTSPTHRRFRHKRPVSIISNSLAVHTRWPSWYETARLPARSTLFPTTITGTGSLLEASNSWKKHSHVYGDRYTYRYTIKDRTTGAMGPNNTFSINLALTFSSSFHEFYTQILNNEIKPQLPRDAYAGAVGLYAMALCLCVCQSQVGVLSKPMNGSSYKQTPFFRPILHCLIRKFRYLKNSDTSL